MPRFLLKLLIFASLLLTVDLIADVFLRTGLERYFGFDRPAEVLLIGHSHTMLGIDAEALERDIGRPVAKYAVNGVGVVERLAMLRQYYAEHPDGAKTVVYDVDSRLLGNSSSTNAYRLFYPFIESPKMGEFLQKNAGSESEFALRRLFKSLRYNATLINLSMRGQFKVAASFKVGEIDKASLQKDFLMRRFGTVIIDPEAVKVFEETIAFLKHREIDIVLVFIPVVDRLVQIDPIGHARVIDLLEDIAERNGADFFNLQDDYGGNHNLFFDPVHLNANGKSLVTRLLAQRLKNKFQKVN